MIVMNNFRSFSFSNKVNSTNHIFNKFKNFKVKKSKVLSIIGMKANTISKIRKIYKNNLHLIISMKVYSIFKKSKPRLIIGTEVSSKIRGSFGFLVRKIINSLILISIRFYSRKFYSQLMSIKYKI